MGWKIVTLNRTVDKELGKLPVDQRSDFIKIAELITEHGLPSVSDNQKVKKLRNGLWEIRIRASSGISRALYITAHEQRVIIVRVFEKKSQKTPKKEIELALKRIKDNKHLL